MRVDTARRPSPSAMTACGTARKMPAVSSPDSMMNARIPSRARELRADLAVRTCSLGHQPPDPAGAAEHAQPAGVAAQPEQEAQRFRLPRGVGQVAPRTRRA
jgi:hypothetical protein